MSRDPIGHRRTWSELWRREPFLSFTILGGLTFLVLSPYLTSNKETIVIDRRTRETEIERRTNLEGRQLTLDERDRAIDDYVRDEILVREAHRNGWHLENGRVRQRIVLAMRQALNENVPEPSSAQLRAFFQANPGRYRAPPSVTLRHVFYEPGSSHDAVPGLSSLRGGRDFRELGEAFRLGAELERVTEAKLAAAFGDSFAAKVFALTPGSWSGPMTSDLGSHYVRVDVRYPAELPSFEVAEPHLRLDWDTERRLNIYERKMARLRDDYTIHVDVP